MELLTEQYRAAQAQAELARQRLYSVIKEAKDAGHSYSQIEKATGLRVSTIQGIVERLN
jgi:uncharacterized protein YerC